MDVHSILLVDGRSNVVLKVFRNDPDVNAVRNFKRLPVFRGHITLFLSVARNSSGGFRGRVWFYRLWRSFLSCLLVLRSLLLRECSLTKVLDDLEGGLAINLGKP